MSWICPIRIDRIFGRNLGALPRLRGRGEQGKFRPSCRASCCAPLATDREATAETRGHCTWKIGSRSGFSIGAIQSVDHRMVRTMIRLRSPRPRKRGSAPRLRLQSAFSLVEVLASLFILTLSAAGITAAWRLADYQELLTRVDRRAERILRQYYELQTFAPPDSRPFTVNASPAQSPLTGYLYYPRLISNQTGSTAVGKLIPFSISLTNGTVPGTSQLVLTYTVPSFGTQASRQVTKTVVLNP
jgi:hypothetical protein